MPELCATEEEKIILINKLESRLTLVYNRCSAVNIDHFFSCPLLTEGFSLIVEKIRDRISVKNSEIYQNLMNEILDLLIAKAEGKRLNEIRPNSI